MLSIPLQAGDTYATELHSPVCRDRAVPPVHMPWRLTSKPRLVSHPNDVCICKEELKMMLLTSAVFKRCPQLSVTSDGHEPGQ